MPAFQPVYDPLPGAGSFSFLDGSRRHLSPAAPLSGLTEGKAGPAEITVSSPKRFSGGIGIFSSDGNFFCGLLENQVRIGRPNCITQASFLSFLPRDTAADEEKTDGPNSGDRR